MILYFPRLESPSVIPAKAGISGPTQSTRHYALDPRLRGDDKNKLGWQL
jgi:hypothetical protein